jgi:hypothetical protein
LSETGTLCLLVEGVAGGAGEQIPDHVIIESAMTDRTQSIRNTPDKPAKKPYKSPRILSRELLEAVASGCTPSPPAKTNSGICPNGPINS